MLAGIAESPAHLLHAGDQSGADVRAGNYLHAVGDLADDAATIASAGLLFAEFAPAAEEALAKLRAEPNAEAKALSGSKGGEAGSGPAAPDIKGLSDKILKQMPKRGWTEEMIKEAFENGEQFPAINRLRGANTPATGYIRPGTGQFVVIDNASGEVIQVGGPNFTRPVAGG